jgi:c-di-GMP-binding flagellar brake protein YcgR
MSSEARRYERIDIELPCRLFIPGQGGLRFEAYAASQNLGLGGVFLATTFLLREGLEVHVELSLPEGPLAIRSRIAHGVRRDDPALATGMGIEFLDVDAHGRETLLRYFTRSGTERSTARSSRSSRTSRRSCPCETSPSS